MPPSKRSGKIRLRRHDPKEHAFRPAPQPEQPGIYLAVEGRPSYDGDTISVRLPMLGEARIRLSGIDAPELNEVGGEEAREWVNSRVMASASVWVWLELARDRDGDQRISLKELLKMASFDRWPGTVYCDGMDIREELARLGLARKIR